MNQKTNLGFLISICHDKVIHIARYLHVDQSLVGKWKNGIRTIDQNSPHLDSLATYMISHHESVLDQVFQHDDNYVKDKHAFMKSYLCSPYNVPMSQSLSNIEHHANYENSYFIYEEDTGRKRALEYYFNCASVLTPGTMHLYDGGCLNWMNYGAIFYDKFDHQIKRLLQQGWKIIFYIDLEQCDGSHSHFDLLLSWLFYENFELHYIRHKMTSVPQFPIYFIEDRLILQMYMHCEKSCYTEVFFDHRRVSSYQYFFDELKRWATFSSSQVIDSDDYMSFYQEARLLEGKEYLLSELPPFYGMSHSLMENVLTYNTGLTHEQKISMRAIQKQTYHHFFEDGSHEICMMFSLTAIQERCQKEGFYYGETSLNTLHHVYIKQEDFKNYLAELTTHLSSHVSLKVGFIEQNQMSGYYHAKEHSDFIYAQDHHPLQIFRDHQLSHLFYQRLQHIWYSLKNKEKAIQILKDSLES